MSFNKEAKACRVLANELTGRHEIEVLLRMANAYDNLSRKMHADAGHGAARTLKAAGTDAYARSRSKG